MAKIDRRTILEGLVAILSTPILAKATQLSPLNKEGESVRRIELTLKDVIEMLCDYEVLHKDRVFRDGKFFYGLTDYSDRTISFSAQDRSDMRDSVIHELLHLNYKIRGLRPEEEEIAKQTSELYQKLFGND